MRFTISNENVRVTNSLGVTLSLGGDDNCRGDGVRDRLAVVFFADGDDGSDAVTPDYLTPAELAEYTDRGELSVWGNPGRYASLLQRHAESDVLVVESTRTAVPPFTATRSGDASRVSVYIHGLAATLAGFDIPEFIRGHHPRNPGEHACRLKAGSELYPCTLVQWTTSEGWTKGLICLIGDTPGLAYARKCAAARRGVV